MKRHHFFATLSIFLVVFSAVSIHLLYAPPETNATARIVTVTHCPPWCGFGGNDKGCETLAKYTVWWKADVGEARGIGTVANSKFLECSGQQCCDAPLTDSVFRAYVDLGQRSFVVLYLEGYKELNPLFAVPAIFMMFGFVAGALACVYWATEIRTDERRRLLEEDTDQ